MGARTSSAAKRRRIVSTGTAVLALALVAGCSATGVGGAETETDPGRVQIPAKDGPGVTATTITVMDPERVDPAYRKLEDTIAAAYSARGGVAGRKVVFVDAFEVKGPGDATIEQAEQAFCAALDEAPKPFVYLSSGSACMSRAGVLAIDIPGNFAAPLYHDVGNVVSPSGMTQRRFNETLALRLRADGVLASARRVGVISMPADDAESVASLVDELRKGDPGYTVQTFPLVDYTPAAELNQLIKMKQAGIDHVVATGDGVSIDLSTFTKQGYEPVIAGMGFPALDPAFRNGTPASILGKIRSYGWLVGDAAVSEAQRAQLALARPGARECADILRKAGLPTTGSQLTSALRLCETLDFLEAALAASGSSYVNAEAVLAGKAELGDFPCLTAFSCRLTGTRPDGVNAVRKIVYDAGSDTFRYEGENLPVATH